MLTACEPGEREVFTYGGILIPRSYAFLHNKAAANMTPGLEVLVHEVIAAMTTDPCFN